MIETVLNSIGNADIGHAKWIAEANG